MGGMGGTNLPLPGIPANGWGGHPMGSASMAGAGGHGGFASAVGAPAPWGASAAMPTMPTMAGLPQLPKVVIPGLAAAAGMGSGAWGAMGMLPRADGVGMGPVGAGPHPVAFSGGNGSGVAQGAGQGSNRPPPGR